MRAASILTSTFLLVLAAAAPLGLKRDASDSGVATYNFAMGGSIETADVVKRQDDADFSGDVDEFVPSEDDGSAEDFTEDETAGDDSTEDDGDDEDVADDEDAGEDDGSDDAGEDNGSDDADFEDDSSDDSGDVVEEVAEE
ncbi:hypothetical protein EK21DRAFT_113399 [Setomelanomma holmii]|uniref:Uncharacterized protein n=1 Tax=Setomelanomma holmii TaxID=210430 RepID=A0A9P4H918_9PLEO|nr:hypothetical protein EK21DRAFT_113399 [Setomelanomma holmii]